jgi:protein phosphatase
MTLTNFYFLNEPGSKKNQEDFIWPAPRTVSPASKIFIVCDGVGGSSNGEIASRMVGEYMGNALSKTDPSLLSVESVNEQLLQARNTLSEYARSQNAGNDMATTFALLLLHADKAFVAWCGDSRVYHFRDGKIIYKTQDHSLVNTLVKSGEISELDATVHPQKNIILKAIKADSPVIEAEGGWTSAIQTGDYFLLCTDGLLENWNDEDLTALLVKNDTGSFNLAEAINAKSFNKTRDNYSMYLLQVNKEENTAQPTKRNKFSLVFFIILFAVVIAGIAYGLNLNKKSVVVVQPAVIKQDTIATKKDTAVPVTSIETSTAQIGDTVQTPVHFEITNPEKKITALKPKADTAAKKKALRLKARLQADSALVPVKENKETPDSTHQ